MSVDQNTISQIDFSIIEAKDIEAKFYEYLDKHMADEAAATLIFDIKLIAKAMNIPQGFIDGIEYEKISRNRFKIVNRWGTREKPLALWFNEGTRDHGPVFKKALHWKDKLTGKDIFAKWVHGIPKTHAMQLGIELGKRRFIQNILLGGKAYVTKELDLVN